MTGLVVCEREGCAEPATHLSGVGNQRPHMRLCPEHTNERVLASEQGDGPAVWFRPLDEIRTNRERRLARAARLEGWAASQEAKASAEFERASSMASVIPVGQPILVGHYSEGRDRRYRDRIARTAQRGLEHARKAESMSSRAANIRAAADGSIYSDDPDAIDRLRERVAELEAQRARIKAYNASCRKGAPDVSLLDDAQRADLESVLRVAAWQCKGGAFPPYALSNLSGNIKRNRDRLAELEASSGG